jgi:hypothetical protein
VSPPVASKSRWAGATRALLLAAGSALVGCDASLEPIRVAEGCPDRPVRGPLEYQGEPAAQLIDDFEDGDEKVAPVSGRSGAWVLGSDGTGALTVETSSRCAARGEHAGHFAGKGFTDWGTNWTAVFESDDGGSAVGHDASAYRAISFWAAAGPAGEPPLEVPVGVTTLDNAWNSDGCTVCMDYYRTTITLTRAWQRYELAFDALAQEGKGDPLTPLKKDELVGLIFWPARPFDLWLDDARFEP